MPEDPTPEEAQAAFTYAAEMGVDMKELGVELADVPDEEPPEETASAEEASPTKEAASEPDVPDPGVAESRESESYQKYQARIADREQLIRENARLAERAKKADELERFYEQVAVEQKKLSEPPPPDPKTDGPGYLNYAVKKNLDEAVAPIKQAVESLTAEQRRKAEREQYNEMLAAGGREIEEYQSTPQGKGFEDRFNTWANRYTSVATQRGVPEQAAQQLAVRQAGQWAAEARSIGIPPSAYIDLQVQALSGGTTAPPVSNGNGKPSAGSNVAHLREVASGAGGKISGAAETPSRTVNEPADVLKQGSISPAEFAKLASQGGNLDVASNVDDILRKIAAAAE